MSCEESLTGYHRPGLPMSSEKPCLAHYCEIEQVTGHPLVHTTL